MQGINFYRSERTTFVKTIVVYTQELKLHKSNDRNHPHPLYRETHIPAYFNSEEAAIDYINNVDEIVLSIFVFEGVHSPKRHVLAFNGVKQYLQEIDRRY